MQLTPATLAKVKQNHSDIHFLESNDFSWSPDNQSITYPRDGSLAHLLHEIGHATLGHRSYRRDIELVAMERDAWNFAATTLAPVYSFTITDEVIQNSLDTYRDWLHARSTCPNCKATGLEVTKHQYACSACGQQWRVNSAILCGLKRYKVK